MLRRALILSSSTLLPFALAACGGGGGGGGGTPPPAAAGNLVLPEVPGLVSFVAGDGEARIWFERPTNGDEFAVFLGTSGAGLLQGAPFATNPPGDSIGFPGLSNGTTYHVAVGTRTGGAGPWTRSGPVLTARPGPPVYVDPASSAANPDGLTPATAFPSPVLAVVSVAATGGNVWLRGGDYGAQSLGLFDGTALVGGFDAGFDLASRDPEATPSILRGAAGQTILAIAPAGTSVTVDGLVLEGGSVASVGVDAEDTPLELRSLTVRECADRGIRLRAPLGGDPVDVVLTDVSSTDHGADGLSAQGTLEMEVFASTFSNNVQEGLEVDDLLADSGSVASLTIDGCAFVGNADEGVDVDLAAVAAAVAPGGTFRIQVRDSLFAANGLTGLLIDVDYEATPEWSAEIEVTGCIARANRAAGCRLDLDSTQQSFVHRSRFEANRQQGLLVSSESAVGLAVVSSCLFAGNRAGGLEADFGNVPVLASHCVFEGNLLFPYRSTTVLSTSASSATWLAAGPSSGVDSFGDGVAQAGDFANVPRAFVTATGGGPSGVVVDQPGALGVGDEVELAADGLARELMAVAGSTLTVDPAVEFVDAPISLAVFDAGDEVAEDHTVQPASPLAGTGMTAPGGPSVDPGPRGSPDAAEPGYVGDLRGDWLRVARAEPAPLAPLGTNDLVRLTFDRDVNPATATSTTVRALDGTGTELVPTIAVVAGAVELTAPAGGWPTDVRVEVDRGLQGQGGTPLGAPVVLVWR